MSNVGQIGGGPPVRGIAVEILLALLILIGASAASMLVGLVLSAISLSLFRGGDEGVLFLQPVIFECITLLIGPVLFATIAANHCRRVPAYFLPLTLIPWLRQVSQFEHNEMIAMAISAAAGLALSYWVLHRKARIFGTKTRASAVQQ